MTRLTSRTADPFRGSLAVVRGDVTWARLRGGEFTWLRPDTYVGADVPDGVGVRVQGLAVWAGPGAVVAGPSAALAWEVECPWDDEEVVLGAAHRRGWGGVTVRQDRLLPDEVTWCQQARVTTPRRTAYDLARRTPLPDAVAAVDALAHASRFGRAELAAVAAAHPRARVLVRVRAVLDLMEPLAESLPESRLRVGLVQRGVPRPVAQYPVRLPSGQRARLDLAWPHPLPGRPPVAVEYDGEEHRSLARHGRDLDRDAGLDDLGWDVVRVTARQLADLDALATRVLRKLGC